MSEADSNNLDAANSPQTEPEVASESNMVEENLALVKLPAASQDSSDESDAHQERDSWIEVLDNGLATVSAAELSKLFDLLQDLRDANNHLVVQVEQLSHGLANCQDELHWYKERSTAVETILNDQNQQLASAEEQLHSLFQELEASHQTASRQQILMETYKTQLEISQERIAQLERECAIIQTKFNDQAYQLLQSETQGRELRARLTRQQRQTLEYKVALEKYLQAQVPSIEALPSNLAANIEESEQANTPQSFFPKAQPIRPWSADPDLFNESTNPWDEPYPSYESDYGDWSSYDFLRSQPSESDTDPEISEEDTTPVTPEVNSFEAQLDNVLQRFFDSQAHSSVNQPTPPPTQSENLDDSNNEAVDIYWEAAEATFEDEAEYTEDEEYDEYDEYEEYDEEAVVDTSYFHNSQENKQQTPHLEPEPEESPQPTPPPIPNANWPSPLIKPSRPPQERTKSRSIQLPTFPPK
ncbi:MAG: hypothetical protein VKL59_27140 [Nostocaceae cyanobacterium]|nr:hypothetical protein [Nostocaceae cyanobacterium]